VKRTARGFIVCWKRVWVGADCYARCVLCRFDTLLDWKPD
jgi:hypothetical protein